jgi:hypothetical protein
MVEFLFRLILCSGHYQNVLLGMDVWRGWVGGSGERGRQEQQQLLETTVVRSRYATQTDPLIF